MKRVILSSPVILEPGLFQCVNLDLAKAFWWLGQGPVDNYCGHETVRILGLEPDDRRRNCESYNEALAIKPKRRLDFGREYTKEEIEEIGVDFILITKVSDA